MIVFDKELAPAVEQVSQRDFSLTGASKTYSFSIFTQGSSRTMPAYFVTLGGLVLFPTPASPCEEPATSAFDAILWRLTPLTPVYLRSIASICIFSLPGLMISLGFPTKSLQG